MNDRELMQQALEALIEARMAIIDWSGYASEYFRNKHNADGDAAANDELITALRERLAQPEQEPVAWLCTDYDGHVGIGITKNAAKADAGEFCTEFIPLYTTPSDATQPMASTEQEPIAWMVYTLDGKSVYVTDNPADFTPEHRALPLYTTPPRREWQGLTDEEIGVAFRKAFPVGGVVFTTAAINFYRAIEAKLREKNA